MIPETFCPLPWIHTAIRNNGDLRVCCQSNASANKGILRDSNGDALNARTSDIVESRNAQLLKDIRKDMLNGKDHPTCVRCKDEDKAGLRSRRQYERDNWQNRFDYRELLDRTESDGTISIEGVAPVYYDIRFGNRCNLRCRMCGPTDSDSWYKDQVKVWGPTFNDTQGEVTLFKNKIGQIRPIKDEYSWVDDDHFWTQLNENIQYIQHIYAVGGEPLLIEKHYDLLQNCIDRKVADKITLEYNSNISAIPDRAYDLWEHFKEVRIGASIDGTGAVDEYIRFPSRWSTIERNLQRLNDTPAKITTWISYTVQVYNILHLVDMIDWKLNSNLSNINHVKKSPIITPHPLHNPSFLNCQLLPPSYKNLVSKKFSSYLQSIQGKSFSGSNFSSELVYSSVEKILFGYEKFMYANDRSDQILKFWNYTKKLDNIRNQSVEDTLPELSLHINDYISSTPSNPIYAPDLIDEQINLNIQKLSVE